MTGQSKTDALLALVALLALGFGAALAFAPSLLPAAVLEPVMTVEESVDPQRALLATAVVVGLFALWRSYFSGATDVQSSNRRDGGLERTGSTATDAASETADAAATRSATPSLSSSNSSPAPSSTAAANGAPAVVGEAATERVERTVAALKRGNRARAKREAVVDDLRATLRAVERADGRSSEEIDERLRTGAWTDDRVAAVFLGGTAAGSLSVWQRLRAWLFPGRTFERRLERTLAELERHAASAAGLETANTETETDTDTDRDAEDSDA